jgi:hypothetical protein
MSARRRPPIGHVRVKVLPKDPLVARQENLWPVELTLPAPTIGDGPTSARVVVVDYNADLDERFAPARLLKDGSGFEGIARLTNSAILDDFTFHQVNVWAIVERALNMLESKYLLARPIPWASQLGRLIVLPHAGYEQNAFYDRETGALHFFYCEGPDGKPVFTCLSHDIIAHELGHAVLDGLKPYYNEVSSPETSGFHEYFGDALAMISSLSDREIAKIVTEDAPERLEARTVVSAIASEFGAAVRGIPSEQYLRGAWRLRSMADLRGRYEEHDWSEVLTGAFYGLLRHVYRKNLQALRPKGSRRATRQEAIQSLFRAANQTANVMFRAIDYCPPVDLRYDEYARAVFAADRVAYPMDRYAVRSELERIFERRGIRCDTDDSDDNAEMRRDIRRKLIDVDIDHVASTPADAYRFLDTHRTLFGIPYEANFAVTSVYRTNKFAKSGYRPPREHIIEFVWSEDVRLEGKRFGTLSDTFVPLFCGGTLVFDGQGNFLHIALVLPADRRRKELRDYTAYLVRSGSLAVSDGLKGLGAPGSQGKRIQASVENGRTKLARVAAMRHARPNGRST